MLKMKAYKFISVLKVKKFQLFAVYCFSTAEGKNIVVGGFRLRPFRVKYLRSYKVL